MKYWVCLSLLVLAPLLGDTPKKILSLDSVYTNLEKTFPVILLSMREIRKAEFDILSAQGAFDLALKGTATNNTGYYDSNRLETNLEKPTSIWGTSFFAGYRVGSGDFPDYYGERRTNSAGEVRFGGRIPLWRDRSIDQGRLDLKQSELNRGIAENILSEQRLGVYRDAAVSYFNWLAAGQRRKIVQDLLTLAETRNEQIKKRVKLGDIPVIEQKENERAILARREQVTAAERLLQKSALYLSLYYRTPDGKMISPLVDELPPAFDPELPVSEGNFEKDRLHALENRPELKRILNEIEMEKNALAFHENQRGPQLDLILRGSRDIQSGTNFRRDPWEGDFSLVFNIPLQTRKQDGKIGGAEQKIEILKTKLSYQKDKINIEARDALIALENALKRLQIIREELVVAESLAKAEKTRFDLGDSTLLIVNLREQNAAEVALRLIGAEADYWNAKADYDAVMMKIPRS
ncbi:MAG: TolC family protein [Turneriella sp.]|nr:TolC family protein [Turneriella sp.]